LSTRKNRNLVLEKVELVLTEVAEMRARGPHFRIYHRFHDFDSGLTCAPGEEIFGVCLVHRSREHFLSLSLSLRLLFDYLARYSRFPQNAAQIEAGIRADRFCTQHGKRAGEPCRLTRKITRSYVRVYIQRLRTGMLCVFREAGLTIDPNVVVVSEATVSSEMGYRLKASFEWVHWRI